MKKILIRILLSSILFSNLLFGLEIPINKTVEIDLKIGEFSVIEFPFEIKGTNKSTFIPYSKKIKAKEKTILKDMSVIKKSTSGTNSVVIKRGKNTFTIFPKKYGKLDLVVWGYTEHPIMLRLKIVSKSLSQYYKFVDYEADQKEATDFESTSHEKVLTKLTRYLFNNETPDGYKNIVEAREYTKGSLKFILVRSLVGKSYKGDEWVIKNLGSSTIDLYEEMFYADGIYSISFENNRIKPLEKIRMFMIKKNSSK